MSNKKSFLVVRLIDTREEIHRTDVTKLSERARERCMLGMLQNMRDDAFIDEVEE